MNCDSAVPADDSRPHEATESAAPHSREGVKHPNEPGAQSHDLRASLAIVNGYSAALGSSFEDLQGAYGEIIAMEESVVRPESVERLMMLEADCRFCLSSLRSSVERLKLRLHSKHDLTAAEPQQSVVQ